MPWLILLVAGLFEVTWAIGLKYTDGFTRLWPSLGTAYAIWTGIGAVGTVILGIVLLGEPANAGRLVSIGLIVAGIVGLKLVTPT